MTAPDRPRIPPGAAIHQVLVSAAPGDAITNMALQLHGMLGRVGESRIYARYIAPGLEHVVCSLRDYQRSSESDVLIFHASIGDPDVNEFLADRDEPIVLMYHNVTPSEYFEPYDSSFASLLALGRREVELLRPRVVRALAASQFNARELEAMGYRDVHVVPPTVDFRRLSRVEPRESTLHHFRTLQTPIVISVAQLMPHKRPDMLVEMMHVGETYGTMHPLLLLIGRHRIDKYTHAIRQQVRELMVNVHVVGPVDDADLAAMFRSATAIVSASEHEGFCLPLAEAMAMDTPIVARACAAVPETVGDAGVLIPEAAGPMLLNEALTEVINNETLRSDLIARGRRRLAAIEAATKPDRLLDAVFEVV